MYYDEDIYVIARAISSMVKDEKKYNYYDKKLKEYNTIKIDKFIIETDDELYIKYILILILISNYVE